MELQEPFDLKATACKVFCLLTNLPKTRDDDRFLLSQIWLRESCSTDITSFFDELEKGKVSHPESVRRIRQKLQERNPSLRGDKWEIRHRMEGPFCEQLTFFDKWGI